MCVLVTLFPMKQPIWIAQMKDRLSVNKTTEDILTVSNIYINGTILPVSQLEQGGALAPLKF